MPKVPAQRSMAKAMPTWMKGSFSLVFTKASYGLTEQEGKNLMADNQELLRV